MGACMSCLRPFSRPFFCTIRAPSFSEEIRLMAVEMKKPDKLRYPWPPLDADYVREVRLEDSWATLAAECGRSDPWDIIRFNFATTNPREVNWYLANWVGCTVVSADGKNLRFGTTNIGKKLQIYIPRPGWYPGTSPHSVGVKAIFDIVRSPAARRIGFTLDGMTIKAGELDLIANCFADDNFGVRIVPNLPVTAQYRAVASGGFPADIFAIRSPAFPTVLAQSLVVHEAVHALDDLQKRREPRIRREAKALIAQHMYIMDAGNGPQNFANPLYQAAKTVAFRLGVHLPVTPAQLAQLYAAIQSAPPDQFGSGVANFDGV
jgi:hypothetical protein